MHFVNVWAFSAHKLNLCFLFYIKFLDNPANQIVIGDCDQIVIL